MLAKGKQVNIPVLIEYVRQRKPYLRHLGLDEHCISVNNNEPEE